MTDLTTTLDCVDRSIGYARAEGRKAVGVRVPLPFASPTLEDEVRQSVEAKYENEDMRATVWYNPFYGNMHIELSWGTPWYKDYPFVAKALKFFLGC